MEHMWVVVGIAADDMRLMGSPTYKNILKTETLSRLVNYLKPLFKKSRPAYLQIKE